MILGGPIWHFNQALSLARKTASQVAVMSALCTDTKGKSAQDCPLFFHFFQEGTSVKDRITRTPTTLFVDKGTLILKHG